MSRIIRVKNNLADQSPYTYINQTTSVGGTTFPVKNTNAFEASWGIQIGDTGEETSEVLVLGTAAPSGTALNTTGTARFSHSVDTPIYAIKYDTIVFEVSTSGTSGVASPITDGTLTIQSDQEYTQFDHTSGASGYAYRAYFENSVLGTAAQTSESDWITDSGFSFYSLAKMRERITNKLTSAKFLADDDQVDDWINEWLETMNNVAVDVNQDYNLATTDVSHGTDGLATITSTDFKDVRRVWFTTDGTDFYKANRMRLTDFIPDETFDETFPYFYYHGDNVIGKKPDGDSGTARITYYRMGTILSNDTDELPVVMQSYTKSFVDYSLSQAYYLDGKADLGDRFFQAAEIGLERFRTEITPRSKTGPRYITISDPVDGDDFTL